MLELLAGGGLLAFGGAVALGIYGSERLTRPPRYDIADSIERWRLPTPDLVRFPTRDGLRIAGWWFASPGATASVVVCHGHGGNKEATLWVAAGLYPRYNVLLIDTRGHGESDASRSSIGFLERLDIIGAVLWVRQQRGDQPVGLLGLSMGAAASILAAADCPEVSAVVADSPFARLHTPVRLTICAQGYPRPLSPLLALLVCSASAVRLSGLRAWRDPIQVVDRLAPRPLLLIHGTADPLIPAAESVALHARASEPKELWLLPGVGHAQAAAAAADEYRERVLAFFQRWLAPGAVRGPATIAPAAA